MHDVVRVLLDVSGDELALRDDLKVGLDRGIEDILGQLAADALTVRVVSMPCWEDFDRQDEAYQAEVLPGEVPTLAVEAGVSFGWDRWADETVSIDRFGASAPGGTVLEELGISPANVVERAQALLEEIED